MRPLSLLIITLTMSSLLLETCQEGVPISRVFPKVQWIHEDIYVTPISIQNRVSGYKINKFSPDESKRNHYNDRDGKSIKYLVMHYTVADFPETIDIFTANTIERPVSAHYVITEKEDKINSHVSGGHIVQVVPEDKSARHVGQSNWEKDVSLNALSIGIEHVNRGLLIGLEEHVRFFYEQGLSRGGICQAIASAYSKGLEYIVRRLKEGQEFTWFHYDEDQIKVSGKIGQAIVKKYGIEPKHVLGHADIAPYRKQDPGCLFPWRQLYLENNLGPWVEPDEMPKETVKEIRESYGYESQSPFIEERDKSAFLQELERFGYVFQDIPEGKNTGLMIKAKDIDVNKNWEKVAPVVLAFKSHFSANQHPDHYNAEVTWEDIRWIQALNTKYPPESELDWAGQ